LNGNIVVKANKNGKEIPYIKNIPVTLIDREIKRQISELISRGFALRGKSERLLQEAKETAEMEIEKGL
jgi:hypothetical protein